ncbi:iron chelate uptake ABC transporter family permease subunit, partial [Streptomyces albidoflavus]|uniref:iron chelate uptake ABC transporter family permease subunit n=1 Tax=Streptomyces albidoflavus TaxID=1886 RepID=UPI000BD169A4
YVLSQAAEWDLQEAMRWLTGSLNGATWDEVAPAAVAAAVLTPPLLGHGRNLAALQLGHDPASALGVRPERTRTTVIAAATGLIAPPPPPAGPSRRTRLPTHPIHAAGRRSSSSRWPS